MSANRFARIAEAYRSSRAAGMSHQSSPDGQELCDVGPANKTLIRAGLEALYLSGSHRTLRPLFGGVGAILTLHHVRPARPGAFQPNRLLEVTPDFLEHIVRRLRRADIDLISLDEMHRRVTEQIFWRKFVCFTFDDGYRDNLQYAWPI